MALHVLPAVLMALGVAAERPALEGTVERVDGAPLPGAVVLVYTARPRVGSSPTCPSCYLDCGKRVETDSSGAFEIPSLDPELLFTIGVLARGHEARFLGDVDPMAGELSVALDRRGPLPEDPRRVVRGRIVDEGGRVVDGAVVEPLGTRTDSDRGWRSTFGPVATPTISGLDGSFALVLSSPADAAYLRTEARGLARRVFTAPTGSEATTLRMGRGRALRGRLVKEGQPLEGVTVGVAQVDRNMEGWVGELTARTDARGRFLLANVVPDEPLTLYGKMEGLSRHGAVPVRSVDPGAEGTVSDLGDLPAETGITLSGRVVLSDGTSLPSGTRLLLGRSEAWDTTEALLETDGTFRLEGLPRETVELSLRVPGYAFSPRNGSYVPDLSGARPRLLGRLDGDTLLLVVLDPVELSEAPSRPTSSEEWAARRKRIGEIRSREESARRAPLQGAQGP